LKYLYVISADNNSYSAWQVKLCWWSLQRFVPASDIAVVVHNTGRLMYQDLADIGLAGGRIVRAPSFATDEQGREYKPRNSCGSLLYAGGIATEDQGVVLLDPDMIFTAAPSFLGHRAGEYCSYLDFSQPHVIEAANAMGVDPRVPGPLGAAVGVPYLIPARECNEFAREWMRGIAAFGDHQDWVRGMYAFGFAAAELSLRFQQTAQCVTNDHDRNKIAPVIHYCYGSKDFEKRDYTGERSPAVWKIEPIGDAGTVLREITEQIAQCARHFGHRK
jgi:hypothetical protein